MKVALTLACLIVLGCSDSTTPPPSYPLQLSIVSKQSTANSAVFDFKVTKTDNGQPVEGAKLRRTNFPSGQTYDLGLKSDTAGNFPHVAVVLVDTLSGVAYQAVSSTLSSNYVRWP
jgi:hypothetical protein